MGRNPAATNKFRVLMIESEAGWGQKIDEIKTFKTKKAAIKFCETYNKRYNSEPTTPSWYIMARLEDDSRHLGLN